jgi:hypothetical protein
VSWFAAIACLTGRMDSLLALRDPLRAPIVLRAAHLHWRAALPASTAPRTGGARFEEHERPSGGYAAFTATTVTGS